MTKETDQKPTILSLFQYFRRDDIDIYCLWFEATPLQIIIGISERLIKFQVYFTKQLDSIWICFLSC